MAPVPSLLIVTGSRSIARIPGAQAWVRYHVGLALDDLGPGCVVLHGGAVGPDMWAGDLARERGHRVVTYLPNGVRLSTHAAPRRWSPIDPGPIARNLAEIEAGVAALRAGYERVVVLGFRDPGSPTDGTGDTLRKAERARLEWWERVWAGAV